MDSPFCYARVNGLTEAMLTRTLSATVVRASIFSEFFDSLVELASVDGELRLPAADGRVAFVRRADAGRVLAACAVAQTPANYDVTGPALQWILGGRGSRADLRAGLRG